MRVWLWNDVLKRGNETYLSPVLRRGILDILLRVEVPRAATACSQVCVAHFLSLFFSRS